jgi:hypothetical protein
MQGFDQGLLDGGIAHSAKGANSLQILVKLLVFYP